MLRLPCSAAVAVLLAAASLPVFAANPITPPGVYIADPSAHAWGDGRLYVYGSRDESPNYYCSTSYDVLETTDLVHWTLHPQSFATTWPDTKPVLTGSPLYAPDAAHFGKQYQLYYCRPSDKGVEGVAFSSSPVGPFHDPKPLDVGGIEQIDPCVFVDDDGTAYYLWGQFEACVAKLTDGGTKVDLSTLHRGVVNEREHHFHEGGYMVKRNGVYYFIYADVSRGDRPTCLGYSTGPSPFGPFTYRGVIIDNASCDPSVWNNHGSLVEFKGRWYVFYHRATHNSMMDRRACVEPITFRPDGSIPEVPTTSQGADGPLSAFEPLVAGQACLLHGRVRIEDGPQDVGGDELGHIAAGDRAAFKFVDFGDGAKSVEVDVIGGAADGWITVSLDEPWHAPVARIAVPAGGVRRTITAPVTAATGVHALWLHFGDEYAKAGAIGAFYSVRIARR